MNKCIRCDIEPPRPTHEDDSAIAELDVWHDLYVEYAEEPDFSVCPKCWQDLEFRCCNDQRIKQDREQPEISTMTCDTCRRTWKKNQDQKWICPEVY